MPDTPNLRVLIVGGGQTAAQTAIALRAGGFAGEVPIFEAEWHPPYERPPLSKRLLLDPSSPPSYIADRETYERLGIALHLGVTVTAIDRAT